MRNSAMQDFVLDGLPKDAMHEMLDALESTASFRQHPRYCISYFLGHRRPVLAIRHTHVATEVLVVIETLLTGKHNLPVGSRVHLLMQSYASPVTSEHHGEYWWFWQV